MEHIKNNKVVLSLVILGIFAIAFLLISFQVKMAYGSAPSGLNGNVATTTAYTLVAQTAMLVAATSTPACSARIITTTSSAVMLTFADIGVAPTFLTGHLQLASTTVVYDSGTVGCGPVRAFGVGASNSTLTVSESR